MNASQSSRLGGAQARSERAQLGFSPFQLARGPVEILDLGPRFAQRELCIASRILTNPVGVLRDEWNSLLVR